MIGSRLAHYEVVSHLGSGGMGEVYAARDTKLGRTVALKLLPETFAHDRDRIARFAREARTLASLNHPNIAALHGIEDSGARPFLVMELVEGETLAARLTRGPLPRADALKVATQIADALDAAHTRGIIHRDLKPANIKIAPGGVVKVLDFGLAKDMQSEADAASEAATCEGTRVGVILGTAAYMSPEQARGQLADKRSDIWSFGCVLYESLTARQPFGGQTLSDIVAAVLQRDPDWTALPASTPPHLRRILRRCLTRDLAKRARDIGDIRSDLEDIDDASVVSPADQPRRSTRELIAWAIAAVLALSLLATVITLWRMRPPMSSPDVTRATIELPADQKLAISARAYPFALSPDGRRLAYVGEIDGRAQLYVREMRDLAPRLIPGTEGARQPFFSPDSQSIAFFAGGALQRVSIAGGAPLRICNVMTTSAGGSWARDGTIVFAAEGAPLSRVSAAGGTPEPIPGSERANWPQILPDGRTILFTSIPRRTIAVLPITGGQSRIIARTTDAAAEGPAILGSGEVHPARYVGSGHLMDGQDPGYVRVLPFDLEHLSVTGSPVSLVEGVERGPGGGAVFFAVSESGPLAYASTGSRHQLVWVDRAGGEAPISSDRDAFRDPQLSPDGTRLAIAINDETRRSDIWIYDVGRGTRNRVTTDGHNLAPVWHPHGGLVFSNGRGLGAERIVEYASDAGRLSILHGPTPYSTYPTSWSPNGQLLLFQAPRQTGTDLWVLMRATHESRPLLERPFNDDQGQFSPDGRFLAYVSDESGRREVFVVRYPELDRKVLVSTGGGSEPRWGPNGRELFYRQGEVLMAVPLTKNDELRFGVPRRLFSGPYAGVGQSGAFDVSRDGNRFVMVKSDEAGTLKRLTLVQNWLAELDRRATGAAR